MEKYSVLMSLYYKEEPDCLRQSINSMINQTIMPDEIVIVKDGPLTEELENVLNEFKEKHPELFNIVNLEKNMGLGIALNIGLENCKNELVARMDTDDISLPDRCEKQLNAFKQDEELSIVSGFISEFVNKESNIIGRRTVPITDKEIKKYLRKRCPLNHVAVMFKKNEVFKAGSYCDWFWNEDYYLWIRMFETGCKFANIPEILVNVRVGDDMYRRRGGMRYFKSEARLQKYMLSKKIINYRTYFYNIIIRFMLQVLMHNKIRGFVFKNFIRKIRL